MNVVFSHPISCSFDWVDECSVVCKHDPPTWTSLYEVIELCSGFGGICQGMATSGFQSVVAVDQNDRFRKLYDVQGQAELLLGDVCQLSTLIQVWKVASGAGVLAAGFACQPFSNCQAN